MENKVEQTKEHPNDTTTTKSTHPNLKTLPSGQTERIFRDINFNIQKGHRNGFRLEI